jgi:hypothetical protein
VTDRWRPLATAPLDGTAVIIAVGRIVGEASHWGHGLGWYWAGNSPTTQSVAVEPDVWQPLPLSPIAEAEARVRAAEAP